MNDSLKPLLFTVGLIDRISGPAARATRSFDGLIDSAKAGFEDMRSGAMGLAATGFMIYESLTPAIEMNRALAETGSIGVQQAALKQLNDTALELSATYGVVAAEVVGSGSQISKAIKGLTGDELSAFTSASSILAATTRATMEESSLYITQMYERFKGTADAMGKAQWVEQLVGKTSYLKKELGSNTADIADAMQGLNNLGSGLGVAMEEQLAVIATLSKSTGISDAEQQYTAFLEYAVAAQDKLEMSFTDSSGKLLPMLDILGKLQTEFGDLSGANAWAKLDEAFGDGSKLNRIPGVNIGTETSDMTTQLPYRKEGMASEVPAGGVTNQLSQSIADNSSKQTTINIQTTEAISPQYVQDQLWQAAP